MAAHTDGFMDWLAEKMSKLNTDHEVFGNYIKGILEGEESPEEKKEALEGILSEVSENEVDQICEEIMLKWVSLKPPDWNSNGENDQEKTTVESKLAMIMEQQAKPVASERNISDEEKKLREAILAQYSQMSDNEDADEESKEEEKTVKVAEVTPGVSGFARNTNTELVAHAEKEKREKAKEDHLKKKSQDKVNREKQKQQQQERKEKEKKRTQKGERKR